jgi:NAD(P)-dependent dehydrogenase (short-subunit alcohol dehydrogenase family)
MPPGGRIVNITGTFEDGGKGWVPYFVSKQALEKFTVALAQDLGDRQILVNAVSPGDTLTPAYAKYFPKYANPETCVTPQDVAKEVLKLCSDKNKKTGKIIVVKK